MLSGARESADEPALCTRLPGTVAAGQQLESDQRALIAAAQGTGTAQAVIWESAPALVVGRMDCRLPQFSQAANAMANAGWPVTVRETGGSAVALVSAMLNLSVIVPWRARRPSLARGFGLLCEPIIACLQEYGIAAVTGAARGSFCDGRYNVLVGGRKIAGTAQRRVERPGGGALLAQATLLVAPDLELITRVVSAFYAEGGGGSTLPSVASITSLQQHVSGSGPLLVSQCAEFLVQAVDQALVAGSSE